MIPSIPARPQQKRPRPSRRSARRLAASLALVLGPLGCGGGQPQVKPAMPPPAWVDRMPQRPGELCAVGYSGPTFYQEDCLKNAARNARGHLADTISTTIRTVTIDISDGTRGMFSRDVFVEGSESASEATLHGSEIQAQWTDAAGARGAPKGCWAMVCIDPGKPLASMVERLEQKKLPRKTVDQVRANAAAAFEELERAEQKREATPAPAPAPEAEPEDRPAAAEQADPAGIPDEADAPEEANTAEEPDREEDPPPPEPAAAAEPAT